MHLISSEELETEFSKVFLASSAFVSLLFALSNGANAAFICLLCLVIASFNHTSIIRPSKS